MLGNTYLHVHHRPQHEHPSCQLLNPTIQFSRIILAPSGFVVNKENYKEKKKK